MATKNPQQLATNLFWVNFVPFLIGIVGEVMLLSMLRALSERGIVFTYMTAAGIFAQLLYWLQAAKAKYAMNIFIWLYSTLINIGFIAFQIIYVPREHIGGISPLVMLVYPGAFLLVSLRAILLVRRARKVPL